MRKILLTSAVFGLACAGLIKKKKELVVERKPNVKVLDHPYNTNCYWR